MLFTHCHRKFLRLSPFRKCISTSSCYFSAEKANFIKNAKYLERLKTGNCFPASAYQQGRFLLMCQHADLVLLSGKDKLAWRTYDSLPKENSNLLTVILDAVTPVGDHESTDSVFLFAVDFGQTDVNIPQIEEEFSGTFINARQALFLLNELESHYIAQARGLINFGRTVKFCSECAGPLEFKSAASHKQCTLCAKTFYPTIAPVGITLIENQAGTEVLLVRQARHPRGMFSCVAGFIEAGESLEENVRREIAEEVGLEVERIEYVSSQHWALPSSQLMLGCIATALSEDYDLDPEEIQEAQWVPREVLSEAVDRAKKIRSMAEVNDKVLWVPPPSAVAHKLMSTWLQKRQNSAPQLSSHI